MFRKPGKDKDKSKPAQAEESKEKGKQNQLEKEEDDEKKGYWKTYKSIRATIDEIKIVSVDTFSRLAKELEHVGAVLEGISTKLTNMIEVDEDKEDNDLRDIVVRAKLLTARALTLFKLLSHGNAKFGDQLTAVDLLLKEVPGFIRSIEYLNIGESANLLPRSTAEMKEKALAIFRGAIEDVFPVFITEQLKKLKSSALGVREDDILKFKQMDHAEQVIALAALHKVNVLMRKLVLRADEFEIRYNLNKSVIFSELKFGIDFSGNDAMKHLSVSEKSVSEWFETISAAYVARLNAFGHENREEVYPYTQAVLQNRKRHLQEMREVQNKLQTSEDWQTLAAKRWAKAESDVSAVIAKARAANEKVSLTTKKDKRLARIKFLSELAEVIKQNQGANMNFMDEFRKTKGIESHKTLIACFDEIEAVFVRVDDVHKHKLDKREKEIKRLDKKIAILDRENAGNVPVEYVDFAEDDSALVSSVERLVAINLREMATFMRAAKMHMPATGAKSEKNNVNQLESGLNDMIKHLSDLKDVLESILDVNTFNLMFAEDHAAKTAELSWVENVGRGYQALQSAVHVLREIQDRYHHASLNSKKVSPQASLKEFVDLASEFSEATAKLAWSMEGLISNPATRAAGVQAGNWRVTFENYKHMVENDPWYIFALGEGQDSAKRLFGADRVQDLIKDASRFYEYAGAKFGHDDVTREKVTDGLADIRHLAIESNKMKSGVKPSSAIGFVFRERHKILSVLPSISQINHSLKDMNIEQGLEVLARVNQMLKKLYLFADEVETTFHLRKGYITDTLLSFGEGADKKSLSRYALEFQKLLQDAGYEFAVHDTIPYQAAIQSARQAKYMRMNEQEKVLKAVEVRLQERKSQLEKAMSEGVDESLDNIKKHQSWIDASIDQMLNQLKVTNAEIVTYNNKYVELSVEDASDNKVALAKEEIHKQLINLMQLQTTVILSRLDRELLFLKARLKVADDVNKSDLQKRIDGIKSECSIAREQIKKLPVTVKRSVKVKVKNASSGSPATKNVAIEINNEINFNIAELKKFKREHQKKSDIVEMIKLSDRKNRLQQIKDLQKDQADNEVDHYEEIAILQNDEHRYIALQSSACANSSEYKRVVAHLYENSVAQLNLDTATTLLKSRIDGEHVEPVEDNSSRLADAKRMAVNYLDVEIEKLRRDKFASPALFRKSKLAVTLKKLDVLTYLRDQYMRSGFKFEDAQSKLQAKNGELYKFGLAHYRSLYNKVKVLDMAPGLDRGRRIVGEDPASKLSTLPMQDDLIAIVKARRAELVNELSNRVVFTSTKKKKIALLEELNGVMMTMPYQAAMKSVRAKYRDTFDLLFEGRTGEVMKSIEVGSYAKSDIQKMIEVEIDQLSLAKSKSNHFFAKLHNARLQSRIKALEELMNNGFDVTKLNKADKKLLEKHEKNLLADCAAFVEHEVRRAAQVK